MSVFILLDAAIWITKKTIEGAWWLVFGHRKTEQEIQIEQMNERLREMNERLDSIHHKLNDNESIELGTFYPSNVLGNNN